MYLIHLLIKKDVGTKFPRLFQKALTILPLTSTRSEALCIRLGILGSFNSIAAPL